MKRKEASVYQPIINHDDMIAILVALRDRIDRMAELRDTCVFAESFRYFDRETRLTKRAHATLLNAPPIDLDDMERHAPR